MIKTVSFNIASMFIQGSTICHEYKGNTNNENIWKTFLQLTKKIYTPLLV